MNPTSEATAGGRNRDSMSIEPIIANYGYWALILGTALEGETILVVAGYLAHRGYFHLTFVIAAAMLGTFIGDQIFFQLGRQSGRAFLARRPNWQTRAERVRRLFVRHRITFVMGFRFMYGIRTVAPFVIGMSGFPRQLLMLLNGISAAVWSITVAGAGYLFGQVLEKLFSEAKRLELPAILAVVGVGIAIWIWHLRRVRKKMPSGPELENG